MYGPLEPWINKSCRPGETELIEETVSPMLPELKRDADGGMSLYIQNDSPA
jgi:hypothetical protein